MAYTIVCFGDSNTHGFDPISLARLPYTKRWPGMLSMLLGTDYQIHEEGLSGRTTVFDDPFYEGLCGLDYITPCLMSHEPVDLLIIMLGTNDAKIRFQASAEDIAQGMKQLVLKAQHTTCWGTNAPNILVVAPPPIIPAYLSGPCQDEMGPGCCEKFITLASLYQQVALELGVSFFDAASVCQTDASDGIHLNSSGHAALAHGLTTHIKG